MLAKDLRRRYIDFFVNKYNHKEIASASLIPENDPTVLFTTAGMHPLVPYFLGEKHPEGTRLVDAQKCFRTVDFDEVGDNTHLTFFEMMGCWSLGDYWKKETITMLYTFLTSPIEEGGLGLDPDRISVTCFEGDDDAPRDEEAAKVWESLGFVRNEDASPDQKRRIFFYNKKENWWGPAGQTGPCGPDSEIFYYNSDDLDKMWDTEPADDETPWVEVCNNVFLAYNKDMDGNYNPLKLKCVDVGLGLERVVAIMQGKKSSYETEIFADAISLVKELAKGELIEDSIRIIADHLRAATFILGDPVGVVPSNTEQGYVLRRLIRRAIRHARKIGIDQDFTDKIAEKYVEQFKEAYPELERNSEKIIEELKKEEAQFKNCLVHGEKEFEKVLPNILKGNQKMVPGRVAFKLYDTYGFPLEMTVELAKEHGLTVDKEGYDKAYEKHQETSRQGAEQKFKGGLADHSEQTTKLHTATHLLHQALRDVLGEHVQQKGSNITADRLRFDFNHPDKMTKEQIEEVERIVNEQIQRDMAVSFSEMTVEEAKEKGAIGLFEDRYDAKIKVYEIGDYSMEICGGPHVEHTGQLGSFRIKKEQSSSAGVRRIKAVLG